ncbi:N-acetyltransferase family protein [Streptomyces sp. NPDC055078]
MPVERTEVQVRPGTEADLKALTALYNHYIRETPITFDTIAFTPEERVPWLRSHPEDGPHRLLVARDVRNADAPAEMPRTARPRTPRTTRPETPRTARPEAPRTARPRTPVSTDVRGGAPDRLPTASPAEPPWAGLLGYATSGPLRPKAAYSTSVEVSVYCAPEAAGRGIGTLLYTSLFDALAEEDVHRAYAGITQPNEASVRLHTRFGFRPIGTYGEVGRKFGRYWDITWYEKSLGPGA